MSVKIKAILKKLLFYKNKKKSLKKHIMLIHSLLNLEFKNQSCIQGTSTKLASWATSPVFIILK